MGPVDPLLLPAARLVLFAASLGLGVGCASSESEPTKPAPVAPETPPIDEPKGPNASVAIASVQMLEDCPSQDASDLPALPSQPASAPTNRGEVANDLQEPVSPGSSADAPLQNRGGPSGVPCSQSTMQLAFTSTGDTPATIKIVAARLLRADTSASVGAIAVRKPKNWAADGSYRAWDETIPVGGSIKASYKLGMPDWNKVEKDIRRPSFGYMFILAVDIEIDGKTETVKSPQFPRQEIFKVVT